MPLIITQILAGLQAAIAATPDVIKTVQSAKALIDGLLEGKVITVAQQQALHAHIDSIAALAKTGVFPAHWQVEADPS